MKFLADMGISPRIVEYLLEQGYDAKHLLEDELGTMPDHEILLKARTENRILLAHDLDFADLVAASGEQLPSVIIFRLSNMRPDHVKQHLASIIKNNADSLLEGCIMSVQEHAVRVRKLPLVVR
jgi:predicted nuclease of predicted toxin-antitoxin system